MKIVSHDLICCLKNYKFHSIFAKNLILIMTVIMLPVACVLMFFSYSYHYIQKDEEKNYLERQCNQINRDFERIFGELRNKAILLSGDNDTKVFFLSNDVSDDEFYDVNKLLDFVALCKASTDVVDDVYIYAPSGGVVIATNGRRCYELFENQLCLEQWENNGKRYQWNYLEAQTNSKNRKNIYFYYTTHQIAGKKGVVVFAVNPRKLDKLLDYGEDVALNFKVDGHIIYDSAMMKSGGEKEAMLQLLNHAQGQTVSGSVQEQMGVEITMFVQKWKTSEQLTQMRHIMQSVICLMILLSVALVFYISLKIFNPIKELMKVLRDNSEYGEKNILNNENELSYLISSMQSTLSRNKDIEEELKERVVLTKKAQSVALQAQINPHFLNNTLESINWMAIGKLGSDNDISEMINCLSQLLRTSLDTAEMFVTIQDEIEYAKKYIYIQQKRLGSNFDVYFSIPQELENSKIIKMLLQPLIENGINYGIRPYDNCGFLKIEAIRIEDMVHICVKDSGMGMTEEEVSEINHSIQETVIKESNHIGLSNVNQRIKLVFGEDYGVVVKSKISKGTEVVISIPYLP